MAEYLRERWGDLVFETEIGTNSKILEASSAGTSVFRYRGRRAGSRDVPWLWLEEVLRRGRV